MNHKFKPFSKNIIFLDTEFSHLNPYKGEILSIGLVKITGEELYLELEYDGPVSPWVKKNIILTLKRNKISREDACEKIRKFVGKGKPYAVAYVNQFDDVYMNKLFKSTTRKDLPFYWLPIDFASILFGMGLDPYSLSDKKFLKKVGVDITKFKHTHNALDDAKLLREVYMKMIGG
jgi:DNA polymerase III epsilon subunit-like protein